MTIEDFEKLPDPLARNKELVKGELFEVPANIGEHNLLRDVLIQLFLNFLDRSASAGLAVSGQGYRFANDHMMRAPDISYLSPAKAARFDRRRRSQLFVPDLAIQIASRNDQFTNLENKLLLYRECEVSEAYLFSIESRRVYRYADFGDAILSEKDLFEPHSMPGFSTRIGEIFDRL